MKIGNVLFLLLLLFCMPSLLVAEQVDPDRAFRVANAVGRLLQGNASLRSEAVYVTPAYESTPTLRDATLSTSYYVFNLFDNGGFVIVGGDDRTTPVWGYATEGQFDIEAISPSMRSWLQRYEDQLQQALLHGDRLSVHAGWVTMEQETEAGLAAADPLCKANWAQGVPYNLYCPMIGSKRTVTGCVATAMAIVMKYHEWPKKGKGKKSYSWQGQTLSADFGATTYGWEQMRNSYSSGGTKESEAEKEAVARLIYHCGVSVESRYSLSATNAITIAPLSALTGYFGYDRQQIDFKSKQYYSDAKWKQMIRTEIDAQRPILYFGQSSVGGHAFVCDGYNNGDKYHINWGWGGYGNGYYALDVLQADDMGNYSNDEQIIIQIMKDEGKEEPESPLLITDAYGGIGLTMGIENVEKGERFQIEVASLVNRSEGAFKGYVSAVLINARGVIKEEIGRSSLTIDPYSYLRRHKLTCEIATNQYLYADDRIGLATSTDKGESWQLIPGGVNVVDRLKVMDNELTYCTISWQKPEEIVAYPTGEELRTRVLYGQDYAFTLRPDPEEYEVKANNTVIVRDASGIYTIPNVKSNQRITIAIPDPVIDVESVTLNPRQVEMKKGETVQLEATVLPQDATNKALYWSSAKPSVATVSTTGKLTALNAGTTTITAKWRDGNVSDLCEVTVASPTGIEERDDAGVQVICRGRLLTLSSSTTEMITLFSVNGTVCMPLFKAPGEKIFDLSSLPAGIFILKSNSGWQQKIRLH